MKWDPDVMVSSHCGTYLAYAFIYRAKMSRPEEENHNQEAAYYTLVDKNPDAFPKKETDVHS